MKKQCIKCGRMLDISEFHKNKSRKDGLHYYCKECMSKYSRERCILLKREAMIFFGGQCVHIENGVRCSKNYIDDLDNLDLIHPNGDGVEHRDLISNGQYGPKFYNALKKRNWDTDGYVLEVRCKSHHYKFDYSGKKNPMYGKRGKLSPLYKKGKFNDPVWLKKKYETMTLQEIADLCGVCHGTIRRRMIEFNMPRRRPGRP